MYKMFWRKTYECQNCKKLENRLANVESDVLDCLAQLKMIRDKVLRRFRGEITDDLPRESENDKYLNPLLFPK